MQREGVALEYVSWRNLLQPVRHLTQPFFQGQLASRHRKVAASALKYGAELVRCAAQPSSDSIRIVQRDQGRIDHVHEAEKALGRLQFSGPQLIQYRSAKLTCSFRQAIHIWRRPNTQIVCSRK